MFDVVLVEVFVLELELPPKMFPKILEMSPPPPVVVVPLVPVVVEVLAV